MFASFGGLHAGVDRQKIRLAREISDCFNDLADLADELKDGACLVDRRQPLLALGEHVSAGCYHFLGESRGSGTCLGELPYGGAHFVDGS